MERVTNFATPEISSNSITSIHQTNSQNKSLVTTEIPVTEWQSKSFLYAISMIYTMAYLVLFIWLLFDGWLNHFQSIWGLWQASHENVSQFVLNYLYLMIGAVFASGIVNVLFLQQRAKKQRFNVAYWNGLFSPLLAAVIAIMVYALLQGLLMIFSGKAVLEYSSEISRLGFLCVGFVAALYFLLQIGNVKLTERYNPNHADIFSSKPANNAVSDPVPRTERSAEEFRAQPQVFRSGSMKKLHGSLQFSSPRQVAFSDRE